MKKSPNPMVSKFVAALKKRRRELKLSQGDLAGLVGITKEGLSKIERGDAEPKLATVLALVELLGGTIECHWS